MRKISKKCISIIKRLIKRAGKYISMKFVFPGVYYLYSRRQIDPGRVVFIEVRIKKISDNYQFIYDRLKCGYDFDLRVHFLEELMVPNRVTLMRGIRAVKDMARAGYIFVNDATNVLNALHVRRETKVVQVWHACGPFKMFGYSVADLRFGATRRQMEIYPIHRNYTHLILGGTESVKPYAEAMGMEDRPDDIYPIGVSRTDIFFNPAFISAARERLYSLMPQARDKKVILYAPTFRGRVASAKSPNVLRPEMLREALGDEFVMVANHHPFVKKPPKIPQSCVDFAMDMTRYMTIEELLCVSDICVTDYSSLVFEYSLFRRPMIFFAHDLDDYYDWRGFYYKYEDFVCGPIVRTNLELIGAIKDPGLYDPGRVDAFREKFMTACDGHATERILKTVFGPELDRHRREKPLKGQYHLVPKAPRRAERKLKSRLRKRFFAKYIPRVYNRAAKRPEDKSTAVFIQYHGNERDEAMNAVAMQMAALRPDLKIEYLFLMRDRQHGIKYLRRCVCCIKTAARAGYLVVREEMPLLGGLYIRPETRYMLLSLNVWPVKRWGRGTLAFTGGYPFPFGVPPFAGLDIAPSASEALRHGRSVSTGAAAPAIGDPGIDLMKDGEYRENCRAALESLWPEAEGKKIVLYAPAARPAKNGRAARMLLDEQLLVEYLSDDCVFVYYYQRKTGRHQKIPPYRTGFIRDMTKESDLTRLMAAADICVTDYLPEAYVFAASGRPMYLFTPNRQTYVAQNSLRDGWNGGMECLDTTQELIEAIKEGRTDSAAFGNKYFAACDGGSAMRCAKAIIDPSYQKEVTGGKTCIH